MGKAAKHTEQRFTLGRSDETWHYGLDCLLIWCPGAAPVPGVSQTDKRASEGHICVFFRSNEYILIAGNKEYRTPDLIMMACYVENFLQKRTQP